MKYYFSDNCYWDEKQSCVIRNEATVKLSKEQTIVLAYLIKHNNTRLTPAALYHKMTNGLDHNRDEDYKSKVAARISRKKINQPGIRQRIPELDDDILSHGRDGDGWYMISIPAENIFDDDHQIVDFEAYSKIWHSKNYFDTMSQNAKMYDPERLARKFKRYLQGEMCIWELLFSTFSASPVRRDVVDKLKEHIRDGSGAVVLTGAGGEGKTTILMQLCAELYREGVIVLYHAPTYKFDIPKNLRNCVFIVDNPPGSHEFKEFLSLAVKEGFTVVIAARSNEWNVLRKSLYDDVRRSIREIEIPRISLSEASAFAECINTNIHWVKRSIKELEELFFKQSYGFLYASMLLAIHNAESLERIAEEIICRVSEFDNGDSLLKVLGAIVFAEHCNVPIKTKYYRFLCHKLNVSDREVKTCLQKEICVNGIVYQTRHEVISQLFHRYLFDKEAYTCIAYEMQEEIIVALLEFYFSDFSALSRNCSPKDSRVIHTANLMQESIQIIDDGDMLEFLVQRLVESCRQHGLAAIGETYRRSGDTYFQDRIAQKAYDDGLRIWTVYRHWIEDIINREYGETDRAREYLKRICVEMNAPTLAWSMWAELEESCGNIGNYDIVYSAAWIHRENCENHAVGSSLPWMKWSAFAKKNTSLLQCTETKERFTPISILKMACLEYGVDHAVWSKWADAELECGNIGNYEAPYTAAWLYREACEKHHSGASDCWTKWAGFASEYADMHNSLRKYTPSAILKMACLEYNADDAIWAHWAEEEEKLGNIGNCQTPHTAAWIYKEACIRFADDKAEKLQTRWADFSRRYPAATESMEGSTPCNATA